MNFIKYFINKYGVLVGGGSLAILLISLILAVYITRGLILILVFYYLIIGQSLKSVLSTALTSPINKAIHLGILAAQMCFLIGGLTESNFSIAKNRFFFLFISAVGIALLHTESDNPKKN